MKLAEFKDIFTIADVECMADDQKVSFKKVNDFLFEVEIYDDMFDVAYIKPLIDAADEVKVLPQVQTVQFYKWN